MKYCKKCDEFKPYSEFTKDKRYEDGYYCWCKSCKGSYYHRNKDKWLKWDITRRYNLTIDEYVDLKQNQNNCCYICGKTEEENNRRLAIDHCHSTNNVRKLLCDRCNRVLGLVKEDKEVLGNMISYLMEHSFED